MMKKKILILGGSGFIGEKIKPILENEFDVYSTGHEDNSPHNINFDILNILNTEKIGKVFECVKPEIVLNLYVIYNNLEFCEKNKEKVMKINGDSLKTISKLVNKFDSYLVQMSTDYVFDGKDGNYNENASPNPINFYGKSKLEGEQNVLELCKKFCIIRTSMVFDKSNIKKTLSQWILEKVKKEPKIGLINDQFMTTTYRENLCNMMKEVIQKQNQGIIHLAGKDKTTRYQFAKVLLQQFGYDESKIFSEKRDSFNFSKNMPKDSSLNVDKATSLLNNKPEELKISIKKLFEKY